MNIVFVTDEIDALGGIQTATHTLAEHLTRRGHHVHAVGLYRSHPPAAWPADTAYQRTVLDAPAPGTPPNPVQVHAAKQRMCQILAAHGSGSLVMSSVHTSLWLHDVDTVGYRRIGHYHGSYEYARTHYHLQAIAEHWTGFDSCVFLSQEDATSFSGHAGLRATSIPNPLADQTYPATGTARPTPETSSPRVLAVGRMVPIKRFDLAIEAFVRAAVAGWQLHLIGDGDQEAALRDLADQHYRPTATGPHPSPAGPVVFRGRQPPTAMPDEYRAAEILAVTSDHEGFGMVIAEAAAAGTPTIAYDVSGGVRSLVRHDHTGMLIPPGNLDAYTRALRRLMTDQPLRRRLGHAAAHAVRSLTVGAVTDRWEALLTATDSTHRRQESPP